MSISQSQDTKTSLKNKLSLKIKNSDSTQTKLCTNIITNKPLRSIDDPIDKKNSDADDSLEDFRSPKEEKESKPTIKFNIHKDKVKKKLIKSKSTSKKRKNDQQSIETLLLKKSSSASSSSDQIIQVKESYPCPLCLKPFKDDLTCTNHMKTCASKNNVTVEKLLDAKRLQERQAEERKAMGLLATPVVTEKKKTFRSKNYSTNDDPQLQLVLAMSESLYEAEQQQELEEAAALAGITSECLKNISSESRVTLKNFGFSTNKPIVENNTRHIKKKKHCGPTILQSRSKEDKDRVLTERIACIITGDDALTQVQTNDNNNSLRKIVPIQLKSHKLKSIEQLTNKLWDISRLTKKCNNFYVDELKFLINNRQQNEEDELYSLEENSPTTLENTSIEYNPVDIELLIKQTDVPDIPDTFEICETNEMNSELDFIKNSTSKWCQAFNSNSMSDIIIFVKNNKHLYAHSLVFYVQCPTILHSQEENNSLTNPKVKKKICWLTKDHQAALAFLEFIYCGNISKYINVFNNKDLLNEVEHLADQYKVNALSNYIKFKQNELKSKRSSYDKSSKHKSSLRHHSDNTNDYCESSSSSSGQQFKTQSQRKKINFEDYKESQGVPVIPNRYTQCNINSVSIEKRNRQTQTKSSSKHDKETQTSEFSRQDTSNVELVTSPEASCSKRPTKSILKHADDFRQYSSYSPDLFDSRNESFFNSTSEKVNHDIEPSQNPSNLSLLVNLINQDDNDDEVKIINETKEQSQNNLEDRDVIVSPKSIINLSQSPHELKTPSPVQQDFCNNLTQKSNLRTTEVKNNCTQPEIVNIDLDIDDFEEEEEYVSIHNVVTPPKRHSEERCFEEKKMNNFLQKLCKINAKDAMDSDYSELDSTPIPKVRNPFLKRNSDNSFGFSKIIDKSDENIKVISMLERDSTRYEKTLSEKIRDSLITGKNLDDSSKKDTTLNNNSVIDDTLENDDLQIIEVLQSNASQNNSFSRNTNTINDSTTSDINEMSMYSRYKKNNPNDNSIHKYRDNVYSKSKNESSQRSTDASDIENTSLLKNVRANRNNSITLDDDSDDEQNSLKFMTQEKSQSRKDVNSSYNSESKNFSQSCSKNEKSSVQIPKVVDCSKTDVIDVSSDEENTENSNNKATTRNNTQSFNTPIKKSNNHDVVVDEFLKWSPDLTRLYGQKSDNNKKNNRKEKNVSNFNSTPINDSIKAKPKNNESSDNCNDINIQDDIGTLENEWFNDDDNWSGKCQTVTKSKSLDNNTFSKYDSPQSPTPDSPLKTSNVSQNKFSELDSPMSPPVSPEPNDSRLDLSPSNLTQNNVRTSSLISSSPILSNNRSQAVKKFQIKSASTSNFETPPKKKKTQKSLEYEDALNDLSSFETPQLHKEMKKFGLKPQNRKNSTLLLKHIYNELVIKEAEKSKLKKRVRYSSDDEEMDNDFNKPKKTKSNPEKITDPSNETDDKSNSKDPVSITDAFNILIKTDKELHNKILTYEPLPLKNLHLKLKENGFKCNINDLMDFLDEQCITFQVATEKNEGKNKKKE